MEDSKNRTEVESRRFKWLIVSQHVQLCDFGNLRKSKVEISSWRRAGSVNRGDFHNCSCLKKSQQLPSEKLMKTWIHTSCGRAKFSAFFFLSSQSVLLLLEK